ncbi:hypothetical protein FGG08_001223 [Glutinoglossum americanum]|uniref:Uncharacterized protein n=1 Tax=Glutinoglossum americanum TaxID=1670608 RepID=A0A9P8IH91_9PEZI|nr:hypothetical protein FGG08_001223 [Glutinoglossum americanum]
MLLQALLAQDATSGNVAFGNMGATAHQSTACPNLGGDVSARGTVRVRDDDHDSIDDRPVKRPRVSEGTVGTAGASTMAKTNGLAKKRGCGSLLIEVGCDGSVEPQLKSSTTGANLLEADSLFRNPDSQNSFQFAPGVQTSDVAGAEFDVRESDRVLGLGNGMSEDVWAGAISANDLPLLGRFEAQTQQPFWPSEDPFVRDDTCAPAEIDRMANARSKTVRRSASSASSATTSGSGYSPFHTFSIRPTSASQTMPARSTPSPRDQLSCLNVQANTSFSLAAFHTPIPASTPGCASGYPFNTGNGNFALEPARNQSSQNVQPLPTEIRARQSLEQSAGRHVLPSPSTPLAQNFHVATSRALVPSSDSETVSSSLDHSGYPSLDFVTLNSSPLHRRDPGEHPRELNEAPAALSPLRHSNQPILNPSINGYPAPLPTPPWSGQPAPSSANGPSPLSNLPFSHTDMPAAIAPTPYSSTGDCVPSPGPSTPCYNQGRQPQLHQLRAMYNILYGQLNASMVELRRCKASNCELGKLTSSLEKQIDKEKTKSRTYQAERDKYRTECANWAGVVPGIGVSLGATVKSQLAQRAEQVEVAVAEKGNAINALRSAGDKIQRLYAQLEVKDREIERLRLALARTNNCHGDFVYGSASEANSGAPTGITSAENRSAREGDIYPGGHLTRPDSGQNATVSHPPAASNSRPAGPASTPSRPPSRGVTSPSASLFLPGGSQNVTNSYPSVTRLILPGDASLALPDGGKSGATAAHHPADQGQLPGKGGIRSSGSSAPANSSQIATPPAAPPTMVASPPTATSQPTAKPLRRAAKPRRAAAPTFGAVSTITLSQPAPKTNNRQQKRAQTTRQQPAHAIQRPQPPVVIDLTSSSTSPPLSPTNPTKRKREYSWLPKKAPKPAPYPSARRLSRESTAASKPPSVVGDSSAAPTPGGDDGSLEAELERELMGSGEGQQEGRRQDEEEGWAEFEADLERSLMECDDGEERVERREEENVELPSDPLDDGEGLERRERDKSVDSLFDE